MVLASALCRYKGCHVHNKTLCPDDVIEMFNPVGSWSVSFGLGAAAMAMVSGKR